MATPSVATPSVGTASPCRPSPAPSLTVVIPAYNEERRLGTNVGIVLAYLKSLTDSFELIVVDDGSTDGTAAAVEDQFREEPRARLIRYSPNRGKGYAVRTGILASAGERVVFMDADLSTPVDEIPRALALLEGVDVVVGSRVLPGSQIAVPAPLYRRLASSIFDLTRHLLVGLWDISDTQCGFKAYHGPAARALFAQAQVNRFMFDVEILYMARQAGLRIVEMPVRWADVAGSKVRLVEGSMNMIRDLLRIRRLHRKVDKHLPVAPAR
ncbi:MAG: glycosyltransferase family 2 protein [Chloroflexi bacterium]|nr:glycosyltransferase family 2 protein [Chloroflexota bacterium]